MGSEIDIIPEITLEDLSSNPWNSPVKGVLCIADKTFPLIAKPDWRLESKLPEMRLVAILVDHNILFTKVRGTLNAAFMQQVFNLFNRIIEESEDKIYLVLDLQDLDQLSLLTRAVMDQNERKLRKFWNHIAIIPSPLGNTMISLYRLFRPHKLRLLTKLNSVSEAFQHMIDLKSGSDPDDPEETEKSIEKNPDIARLTREELIVTLNDQLEDHRKLKLEYQAKIDRLFEYIGRITWDKTFQPSGLETDETDPFFNLFNAVTFLRQDVADLIDELKIVDESLVEPGIKQSQPSMVRDSNLRAILENNDASIWLLDDQYRLIDFNESFAAAFETVYGASLKPGMVKLDYLPDKALKKTWKERYDNTLKGQKGTYIDSHNFGDRDHIYEITTYPIRHKERVVGISIFSREITQQKSAQKKLLRRNRQLKKLNRELDRFAYSVSHDLRAPLISLQGLIEVALKDHKTEHLLDYLNKMNNSVKKLEHFIEDVTSYSRNTKVPVSTQRIDFKKLVGDTLEELKYINVEKKVEKKIAVEGVSCYSDPNRLHVIMSNLISNSFRYTDPEKSVVKIGVSVKADPNQIRLSLRDNGIGIEPLHLKHIFEMFYRGTDKSGGSGLGLYIVKETITKLNGSIRVKSNLREGCTFTIKLPNLKPPA